MKLCQLDSDPYTGDAPITLALSWLQAVINSPNVSWNPQQKEAAIAALLRAQARMHAEVFVVLVDGVVTPRLLDAAPEAVAH